MIAGFYNSETALGAGRLVQHSAGGCDPVLDIGVSVDPDRGEPGIENARQFKIADPTRDSWAWNLSPGTFMWFTTEWQGGGCSMFGFNAFAVWDGRCWTVPEAGRQYAAVHRLAHPHQPLTLCGVSLWWSCSDSRS